MAKEFTDQNFEEEVIKSSMPVLVDFWAPWCAPCQMLGPVIEKMAEEYEGKIKVGKLNVDENRTTTQQFEIRGIPAVKIFKNGEVVQEFTGTRGEEDIKRIIDEAI